MSGFTPPRGVNAELGEAPRISITVDSAVSAASADICSGRDLVEIGPFRGTILSPSGSAWEDCGNLYLERKEDGKRGKQLGC